MGDVARLRRLLGPLEAQAKEQRWDRERPWRVATHVRQEGDLTVVDLHDLKVTHAKRALRQTLEAHLDDGAVVFVTGRGRHSLGPGSALKRATHGVLQKAGADHPDWSYRIVSPGRVAWIYDRARAPSQLTGGGMGWLWLWFALLALALLVGLWGKLGG